MKLFRIFIGVLFVVVIVAVVQHSGLFTFSTRSELKNDFSPSDVSQQKESGKADQNIPFTHSQSASVHSEQAEGKGADPNSDSPETIGGYTGFKPGADWEKAEKQRPLPSRASTKLRGFKVLEAEKTVNSNGNILRRYLVETEGKYSPVILLQEVLPEGNEYDFKLVHEIAYAAGHVLGKASPGQSESDFIAKMKSDGYVQIEPLGRTGVYKLILPEADLQTFDEAMLRSTSYQLEPDYLVFSSESLESSPVVLNGDFFDPQSALSYLELEALYAEDVPRYSAAAIERQTNALAGGYSDAVRVLTFDDEIIATSRHRRPQAMFHNFIVQSTPADAHTPVSVGVSNGGSSSGFSHNGSNILWVLNNKTFLMYHKDGIPFTIHQVDLSEYSTVFAYPNHFIFTGVKSNGSTVSQTFSTDGIIDGTGPESDFQTFYFNSTFHDIVELRTSRGASYDNFVVTLEGQETPLRPNPELPLYYDVDWNDQTIGETSLVGSRYAPSSLKFGEAVVRASGSLPNEQAIELDAGTDPGNPRVFPYAQLQWELYGLGADRYIIEFKCDLSDSGRVLFDGLSGSGYPSFNLVTGYSNYRIEVDRNTGRLTVERDGILSHSWDFDPNSDISTFRFNVTDTLWDGGNYLYNFKLFAYGIDESPVSESPEIRITPASGMSFPTVAVGGEHERVIKIRNMGSEDLIIYGIQSNSADFTVDFSASLSLIPGGEINIPIIFSPSVVGEISGNLQIESNDPDQGLIEYPLSGRGKGTPHAEINPEDLLVSVLQGDNGIETFTIGNQGDDVLNWRLIDVSSTSQPFPDPVQTNDPSLDLQWALQNSDQAGTSARIAWNYNSQLTEPVTVAVVDTGVDLDHPDLLPALVINTGEIPDNLIDDDGNGFKDDVYGWNFYHDNHLPDDSNGHGSHVAGIIGATQNNGIGIAGISGTSRILAVQFLGPTGAGYTSDAIRSIDYCHSRGAQVLNASWGGGGASSLLEGVIRNFTETGGGLFVAAAGNDTANNDVRPQYPSNYNIEGLISVAATDRSDDLARFSNYGPSSVDLAAPGVGIISTYRQSQYASLSGTSMAAPHVAGAASFITSQNPGLSVIDVKNTLLGYVNTPPGLNGLLATHGRLNIYNSLSRTPEDWINPQWVKNSVPSFSSQTVELEVRASHLSVGTYQSLLAFTTDDPENEYLELPVTLQVLPANGKNQWRKNNFAVNNFLYDSESVVWLDSANPDGDQYSNLLEYILGSSPLTSDSDLIRMEKDDQNFPAFIFEARDVLEGASYVIEWSENLSVWKESGILIEKINTDTERAVSTWKVIPSSGYPGSAFFRLKILSD